MMQVVEIVPRKRQGSVCPTSSIPWLLMTWWQKEPGHQQLWCWRNSPRKFHSQQQKGQSCIVPGKWCSVVLFDLMLHMYINFTHLEAQFNSLVPGRWGCNLKLVIFKLTSRVDILSFSCEIALRWMPQDFTDDKSTLGQVMAWQQAIIWANVDPDVYRHMGLLSHNELMYDTAPP